ncbi:P-loop containing nucleoside triphosphate hydrolase protein [Flagelloscypha sp. PMI_526]|nr:P-loop containing nucleoside triphosphate hydrolase protein [Flagelloscypha sp. PMI_526]
MPTCRRKLVIVGDGAIGKTSLLTRFVVGIFPEVYVPVVSENFVAEVKLDGRDVELALWDTMGQDCELGDRLRPLTYADCHVVLLAYSIDYPDSFDNIQERWISELREFIPKVPIIVVGCKKDLRDDERRLKELARHYQRPISFDEGLAIALKIGAGQFLECSAKTGDGVDEVFETAARAAMEPRAQIDRKANSPCVVL